MKKPFTLRLDPALLEKIKAIAIQDGQTVTKVIENALWNYQNVTGLPTRVAPDPTMTGIEIIPLAKPPQKADKQAYVPKQFPPLVSFKPKKHNKNG